MPLFIQHSWDWWQGSGRKILKDKRYNPGNSSGILAINPPFSVFNLFIEILMIGGGAGATAAGLLIIILLFALIIWLYLAIHKAKKKYQLNSWEISFLLFSLIGTLSLTNFTFGLDYTTLGLFFLVILSGAFVCYDISLRWIKRINILDNEALTSSLATFISLLLSLSPLAIPVLIINLIGYIHSIW